MTTRTYSSGESENSGPEIWDIEPDVECEPSNLEKEIIIVIIHVIILLRVKEKANRYKTILYVDL